MGPSENCTVSSPVRLLIQKLFWASDEDFKIASCIVPQTRYHHAIQIWRVIRWPLFLFKHLWTVIVETLLRDTCNARRAICILLSGSSRVQQPVPLTLGTETTSVKKKRSERRKHCALALLRRSQKISPHRRPHCRGRRTAKI